jgi:Methyltransferase domain
VGLRDRLEAKLEYRRRQRHGFDLSTDSVFGWLDKTTVGLLHHGQYRLFERAVAELPTDDPVIEIGAFGGLSTNAIAYVLRREGRTNPLITIDPWDFEREEDERDTMLGTGIPLASLHSHIRRQFEDNCRLWSGDRLPYAFELRSDDFFAAWDRAETRRDLFGRELTLGGKASFVFIDGDHRLEQATRDFDNADRILVPGGFILLDDSDRFGHWPELWRLGLDACRRRGYEKVAENPNLLLRKAR